MEKCTNYDHCNNTVPSVKNKETPYQFCSWDCNESHYLQEGEKIRLEFINLYTNEVSSLDIN